MRQAVSAAEGIIFPSAEWGIASPGVSDTCQPFLYGLISITVIGHPHGSA
jgi:hypothetical protein